jgi:hypothetical protein
VTSSSSAHESDMISSTAGLTLIRPKAIRPSTGNVAGDAMLWSSSRRRPDSTDVLKDTAVNWDANTIALASRVGRF